MSNHHWRVPFLAILLSAALLSSLCLAQRSPAHAASAATRDKRDVQILPRPLHMGVGANVQSYVTAPAYTTSHYESTTSASTMQSQGCTAAKGPAGLIVLDFGEPEYSGGVYGTKDFGGNFDSDDAIFHAVANFIYGAWNCHTSATNIAVAVGTSNYGGMMGGYSASAWYTAGQDWGNLVNNDQSYSVSNGYNNQIGIYGADDAEVGWANYTLSSNFVNGYNNTSSRLFFDYGDDAGGTSPSPWTAYEVWYVAYGAADDVPLPEIYYNADATSDWAPLSAWACSHEGGPIYFKGTMAEYPTGNSPATAFDDLYNALGSNSCTAQGRSSMIFSTNI